MVGKDGEGSRSLITRAWLIFISDEFTLFSVIADSGILA